MRRRIALLFGIVLSYASSGKSDLEAIVKGAYKDRGLVTRKTIEVKGHGVEFLEAGHGSRVVLFCHGAAFSMNTWQWVGVLDALALANFRAIAVNLPGYGFSSKTQAAGKDHFLSDFIDALRLTGTKVCLIAASMGGTYAIPYILQHQHLVAGYVTAAGLLSKDLPPSLNVHTLFIYGDQDPRLDADSSARTHFSNSQLTIFKDAPHPCYLRDLDATNEFTALVLSFVGAPSSISTQIHAQW